MNDYKIIPCPECKKHYIVINPFIKDEKVLPCFLVDRMTKKQAIQRANQLPNAKKVASIYNHNSRYAYN